jgi:DNA-binding transcriptional MerR regulator
MYTVKQMSQLAGVSSRTLRYYDQVGLLKPSSMGSNGHRYYEEDTLLIMQQILFYREMGLSLENIKAILTHPAFDVLAALRSHREALQGQVRRLNRLLHTVDHTINHLKGSETMKSKGFFEGFSDEEQEKYALEAEQMYDPEVVRASNRRWKAYPPAEKERILAEGKAIYTGLIAAMPDGAASPEAQGLIARWHHHLQYFWNPNDEQLLALANGYNEDARFRENFAHMHPKLAEFVREAVGIYVAGRKK